MKKVIQILAIAILIILPFVLLSQPMPWDPSIGGGTGSTPVGGGGGAPIGEGIILLVSMGIWYGVRKWRGIKNSDN